MGYVSTLDVTAKNMDSEDDYCMIISDDSDVEILDHDGYYRPIKRKHDGAAFDEEEIGEFEEGFRSDASDGDSDATDDDQYGKESYTILTEEHILELQQQNVTQVCNTLSVPRVSATILLQHYKWDVDEARYAWFAAEEEVRKDVGLLEEQIVPIRNTESAIVCGICLDEFPRDDMCAATCGHLFCNLCWTQYISMKISDGAGCLVLRCPDPSCAVAVGQDMVDQLVSDEDKEKYSRYLCRSYVEHRKKNIKWCPGPGCEFAVEFVGGGTSFDVVCRCRHSFCWNCVEDVHNPVDCDTVHKWVAKNSAESENVVWILANSKSCPKCKRPIQKNEGCMHMTCPCGFHFCWLCLGDWRLTHGKDTGGYYACNIYAKVIAKGQSDEVEEIKYKAKDYLDRYAFYYERFAENQKSRLKAVESLQEVEAGYLKKLSDRYRIPETELDYITKAWLQIIECRRVLKWTYAYGYYLPTGENVKKEFFEFYQGEAESGLERLHRCAEVELHSHLGLTNNNIQASTLSNAEYGKLLTGPKNKEVDDKAKKEFTFFHTKLVDLTNITRKYFDTLVRALENGLSDVDSSTAARETRPVITKVYKRKRQE